MVDTPEVDLDEPVEDEPPSRPPGGAKATVGLLVVVVPFLGWAGVRFASLEVGRVTAALVALTQYAVPVGALLLLLALLLRRWLTVLVVGAVTAVLTASVAPRAIPDDTAPVQGQGVTVLTANTYFGKADASRIVRIVRRHDVDVLSLQELTPGLVAELERAGLFDVLGHRVLRVGPGSEGSGIVSRYPLEPLSTPTPQPSALVDLPGNRDMQVVAVHPVVPVGPGTTVQWKHELGALPGPTHGEREPVRVLAGDFNATLDHTPMRQLLGRGYSDAAEVTGDGLAPTWPTRGRPWAPPVTLDHVLVGGDVAVRGYRTFEVAGTDHRAVLAHLVVP